MSNLKRCPFCNGDKAVLNKPSFFGKAALVSCSDCRAEGPYFYATAEIPLELAENMALFAWNRRDRVDQGYVLLAEAPLDENGLLWSAESKKPWIGMVCKFEGTENRKGIAHSASARDYTFTHWCPFPSLPEA